MYFLTCCIDKHRTGISLSNAVPAQRYTTQQHHGLPLELWAPVGLGLKHPSVDSGNEFSSSRSSEYSKSILTKPNNDTILEPNKTLAMMPKMTARTT